MAPSLDEVLNNIKDPREWADYDALVQVMQEVPSLRGMVYGNVVEVEFAEWLVAEGIPPEHQQRDDDHAKTKSDRTIVVNRRRYTIQMKSMQTNSIKETTPGSFAAKIQCDASDRREITLSTGKKVSTTCYRTGEFDILAVGLHPFYGDWRFAFRTNESLPRSAHRGYTDADRSELLKTLVDIEWPLPRGGAWTDDLFHLLRANPLLGTPV